MDQRAAVRRRHARSRYIPSSRLITDIGARVAFANHVVSRADITYTASVKIAEPDPGDDREPHRVLPPPQEGDGLEQGERGPVRRAAG